MEQYYITPQSFDEDLRKLSHDSKRRAPSLSEDLVMQLMPSVNFFAFGCSLKPYF